MARLATEMIEINSNNSIFRKSQFCRRIVPDGTEITDPNWEKRLEYGAGFGRDIILHKASTQVPAGFKVVQELARGDDMGMRTYISSKTGKEMYAVHICKREEDGEYSGHIDGMWYKWVPVEESLPPLDADT
jgi:hypothetical protein